MEFTYIAYMYVNLASFPRNTWGYLCTNVFLSFSHKPNNNNQKEKSMQFPFFLSLQWAIDGRFTLDIGFCFYFVRCRRFKPDCVARGHNATPYIALPVCGSDDGVTKQFVEPQFKRLIHQIRMNYLAGNSTRNSVHYSITSDFTSFLRDTTSNVQVVTRNGWKYLWK